MRLTRSEPAIAWATLVLGIALFVGETIHWIQYGGTVAGMPDKALPRGGEAR